MRNLRNLRFDKWQLRDISQSTWDEEHDHITATCWDAANDEVLGVIGPTPTGTIELVRIPDGQPSQKVASWDAPSPNPDLPVDKVLCLQHLSGTGTTCIVLEGGDIITVQEQDSHGSDAAAHIEIVGSIDSGIAAARWSPDEELLVVVTKAGNVIFMGSTFDPVTEVEMTAADLGASKHVSVGWGKKETQFQGRGARALRDPTIPEKVDEGLPSDYDKGETSISWRGDGAYVAINSVQKGERRVIRVYSREGELDSASEPVDRLESSISWRPSGNLIAGLQRFENRVDVVFFERNGLRHGEFSLKADGIYFKDQYPIRLEWNSDSTVLAVVLQHRVQLWTMGNYHWYLKQEIALTKEPKWVNEDSLTNRMTSLTWHPEKALRFVSSSTNVITSLEYIFHTARGSCEPPNDNGAVAVIDGNTIKLTAFKQANVPPPMAQFELDLHYGAVDVAFGAYNNELAVLHQHGVDFYERPMRNGQHGQWQQTGSHERPWDYNGEVLTPLAINFSENGECFVLMHCSSLGHFSCLSTDSVEEEWFSSAVQTGKQLFPASAPHLAQNQRAAFFQDRQGMLYRLADSKMEPISARFKSQLPWFEVAKVEDSEIAFGLTRSGHLYANTRQLVKNCTSFILTPDHLVFTTNNHFVKFVHLVPDVEDLDIPGDDPEIDERCRSVERGSRIVTAMPRKMSIVLQMPRGNLETIFPRAMVLAGIRNLINEKDYGGAYAHCRTQRVDFNILCDHQPAQFLANVGLFLDQVKQMSYIDLFLSSLREDDVTQTMYKDTKRPKEPIGPAVDEEVKPTSSKVNTICDAVLHTLKARKATNLQNIITAHVCKNPPALEDGLSLVAELMGQDEKLAESAVEHICFLVDVNRLYDHALGLYNLELALLVAQQSQRDPREYLPFIQDLHQQPDLRKKFSIDDHLARREKALSHLKALDAFDELCDFTTKHSLYAESLGLYRYDEGRHHTLTGLYAAHLESSSSFREAGLAYESLQNYAKATDCYRAAGAACWQECLFSAKQQTDPPISEAAMFDLAGVLADALWEAKDFASAAEIHLDYLSSPEMAIKCLCKGYHFASAMRLTTTLSQPALISAIDTGLADALSSTTEFLADCKAQLRAQVPRIMELRKKAEEDPLSFYEGERAGGADIPDDISVAASSRMSTSASLFTRYTGSQGSKTVGTGVSRATSRNRKREEKKRARGRKGTVYEEEYLVNSVRRLVERVEASKGETERLVFALARRGMAERARAAEALMADVFEACEKAVSEVFVALPHQDGGVEDEQKREEEVWRPVGGDAVLQDWEMTRRKRTEPPVVTKMKKLTLLGS